MGPGAWRALILRSSVACFGAALVLSGCARSAHSGLVVPRVGSVATLGGGASHGEAIGEPCLPSRSELDAVLGLGRSGSRIASDHDRDDAIPLAPRMRVRILARAARDRDVRLRMLDGPWAGTACWVDGRVEDLFASG
jgi:hypothetical protein